jgi:soluble lytic murein transglycosylase-like protein
MALPAQAGAKGICERQMALAAARHGVPLGFLYAIGLTETGRRKMLHPWALNIRGRTVFAASKAEALRILKQSLKEGETLVDTGCMQINYRYHNQHFSSLAEMFDPALNVDYAARFLKRLHAREKTWTLAAARYHAGPDNNAAQKRYVCVVIRNLIASGFGKWTPQAKAFCN